MNDRPVFDGVSTEYLTREGYNMPFLTTDIDKHSRAYD